MSFTVTIDFTGLCLFVADRDEPGLHVLLPEIPGEAGGVPRLSFDGAYRTGGSTRLEDDEVGVELRRIALEVTARGATVDHPEMPLAGATNPAAVDGEGIAARVTLRGGALTRPDDAMPFMRHPEQTLSPVTRWTGECEGDALRLAGSPLGGGSEPIDLPALHPIDGEIRLRVIREPVHPSRSLPAEMRHPAPES